MDSEHDVTYRITHMPNIGRYWWSVSRTGPDGCHRAVRSGACDTEEEALAVAQASHAQEAALPRVNWTLRIRPDARVIDSIIIGTRMLDVPAGEEECK